MRLLGKFSQVMNINSGYSAGHTVRAPKILVFIRYTKQFNELKKICDWIVNILFREL